MNEGPQWFDVDLETLRLQEIDLKGWPGGMTARTRMKEECLESVVAFNLEVLFPREDLLLVGADFLSWKSSDVLAIDPFGYLRLMELKKVPTELEKLEEQVISYGIDHDRLPPWDVRMARGLTSFPERVENRLQGFRANQRTEKLGQSYVERHTPDTLDEPWSARNRFERAHLVSNALRAAVGTEPGPPTLQNAAVSNISNRVYGLPLADIVLDNPDQALGEIVSGRWGDKPSVAGTEFTLVAPDLARRVSAGIPLEQRGAHFNLIDAELRHSFGERGVERAVLRWEPVHRTAMTYHAQTAATLRKRLRELRPTAAAVQCDPWYRSFYWGGFYHTYLWVREDRDHDWVVETRFDSLTEGLADLKPRWHAEMRTLCQTLPDLGHQIRRTAANKLAAPWDVDNLEPAAKLFTMYHAMLQEAGFFDVGEHRWYRRPVLQE